MSIMTYASCRSRRYSSENVSSEQRSVEYLMMFLLRTQIRRVYLHRTLIKPLYLHKTRGRAWTVHEQVTKLLHHCQKRADACSPAACSAASQPDSVQSAPFLNRQKNLNGLRSRLPCQDGIAELRKLSDSRKVPTCAKPWVQPIVNPWTDGRS